MQKKPAEVTISASLPHCCKKNDNKAQLQLTAKKVLPFKAKAELQEILDEVMEQAEARCNAYDMRVAYPFTLLYSALLL